MALAHPGSRGAHSRLCHSTKRAVLGSPTDGNGHLEEGELLQLCGKHTADSKSAPTPSPEPTPRGSNDSQARTK